MTPTKKSPDCPRHRAGPWIVTDLGIVYTGGDHDLLVGPELLCGEDWLDIPALVCKTPWLSGFAAAAFMDCWAYAANAMKAPMTGLHDLGVTAIMGGTKVIWDRAARGECSI